MNANRIKQVFVSLAKALRAEKGIGLEPGIVYRDSPMKIRGELFLAGERASKYFEAFEEIVRAASSQGTWSKDSIDKLLCERLVAALSAENDGEVSAEANTLIATLQSQPIG